MRLGPNASGAMAQNLKNPRLMPPTVRKASPREISTFLQNPNRIGHPASMNTDAYLRSREMGYLSWEIAFRLCEAGFFNFVRPSGPVAKGDDTPQNAPARRGKAVFCPCCVMAMHVAIPVSYKLRPFD